MKNKMANVLTEERKVKNNAIVKKVVSRFSRGNVNLQSSRYLTREDQDARITALAQYDFFS